VSDNVEKRFESYIYIYSYASTPPLSLRNLLQGDLYLYL